MTITLIIPDLKFGIVQNPVGILNVASILKEDNDVKILDLRIDDFDEQHIRRSDLLIIPTSTYDFMQCYSLQSLDVVEELMAKIRGLTNSKVFLIGPHGTILPKPTLEKTKANGVIQGEFERSIPAFVENFTEYSSCEIFPCKGLKIRAFDVDSIDVDYSLVDVKKYKGEIVEEGKPCIGNSALILGSRGCPFKCNFCYNLFGPLKMRKPERIISEIKDLYNNYNVDNFFFLDYTFTANKKWVLDLCASLIKLNIKINWICQTRIDTVSEELLGVMNKAGCSGIWYGVENPFKRIGGKSQSPEEIEQVIRITKKNNILPIMFLLFQTPFETKNEVLNLKDWILKTNTYFSFSSLFPRPGTKLFDEFSNFDKDKFDWSKIENIFEKTWDTLEDVEIYTAVFKDLKKNKKYMGNIQH